MFNVGMPELLVILVLVLLLYGPGKLPQIGAALGKAIGEFKKAARSFEDTVDANSRITGDVHAPAAPIAPAAPAAQAAPSAPPVDSTSDRAQGSSSQH